jgi:hypothetical protein
VEERGGLRLSEKSKAKIDRSRSERSAHENPIEQRRCTSERAWFEGKHLVGSWARPVGAPSHRLCPSEQPKEAMAHEAHIEGWFPLYAEEPRCFDLAEDAHARSDRGADESLKQSSVRELSSRGFGAREWRINRDARRQNHTGLGDGGVSLDISFDRSAHC